MGHDSVNPNNGIFQLPLFEKISIRKDGTWNESPGPWCGLAQESENTNNSKKSFTFRQSGKSPSRAARTLNYNYTTNNKTMNANIHISWLQHKILLLSTAMYRFSYIGSLQLAAEFRGASANTLKGQL